MKKTLVLIRHAKSSWADPYQDDSKRPLNERGEQDAPVLGKFLKKQGIIPDLIISSTAKRARQTAKRIAGELEFDKEKIELREELYLAAPEAFEKLIMNLDDDLKTVFMVGHNPGITEFVNSLSDSFKTDDMPTCAIAGVHLHLKHWSLFLEAEKEVFIYEYPKKNYGH